MPGRNTRTNPATSRSPVITSLNHVVPSQTPHAPGVQITDTERHCKKATSPMLLLLATSESDAAVVVGEDPQWRHPCGGVSGGCSCSL